MAFTFGFYNSMNGDRKYNADQISELFDGLIKDGVFHSQGEIFAVTPGTGMQVLVGTGKGWFNRTWNKNDSKFPLNLAQSDVTLPRYDAVVLEVDSTLSSRTNRFRVLTGSPASTPAKPIMTRTTTINQYPLAYVLIPGSATSINSGMIQNVIGTSECPFVTGILASVNIDVLFAQWQSDFMSWWDSIKAVLDDNIATNLQNQINLRLKIADVATQAEAYAGTNNTKWMSPFTTNQKFINDKAATAEAISGTSDTKWVSPYGMRSFADAKLPVIGKYTGNDAATRAISLGFQPNAVLIIEANPINNAQFNNHAGFALSGSPAMASGGAKTVEITSSGFNVAYIQTGNGYTESMTNVNQRIYHYIAWR